MLPTRIPCSLTRIFRSLTLLTVLIRCCLLPIRISAETSLEYKVKAAFLLNFAKFVEWPPTAFPAADSPIAICIVGRDPFGSTLDDLVRGEVIDGRKLVVRRIPEFAERQACHILFAED